MRRLWPVAAKCLLAGALGVILLATNDLFLMVGGSESTSFLVAPPDAVQLGCLIVFAGALLVPANHFTRGALALVALGAALVGGHRLIVDNLHNEIRDVYLGLSIRTLPLDPAHEGGLAITRTAAGLRIGQAGRSDTLWLLSPAVIGFDPAALQRLTG